MKINQTKLLILGGGPGGYVAALRAAQLGIDTTLVEGLALGGTCLNVGCIPSKALIHVAQEFHVVRQAMLGGNPFGVSAGEALINMARAQEWKQGIVTKLTAGVGGLLKRAGVRVVRGWAQVVDGKTVDVETDAQGRERIACEHLLLATGSEPIELPGLPYGGPVLSSTTALSLAQVPRHLVVVGAGYIGLELGLAWRRLGAEVAIVEASDRILPGYDEELTRPVATALTRAGITLRMGCIAEGLSDENDGVRVRSKLGDEFILPADNVLVAVGRRARTQGYGLEALGLDMESGAVKVDLRCHTSMRDVWAIGDLTGEPMLAHRAMAQGEVVAECIAGHRREFNPRAIPAICFTDPEVVTVGQGPADCAGAGIDYIAAQFPFAANGRALSLCGGEGFVRVIARSDNRLLLGWQAVGPGISELAAAFSYSLEMNATLDDVASILHAHPTLGEAVQESAFRALGRALHI